MDEGVGVMAGFGTKVVIFLTLMMVAAGAWGQGESGTVIGVVKDASGALVAGASVSLRSATGKVFRSLSGGDGSYAFQNVPVGGFVLSAMADGLETRTVEGAVQAGATTDLGALELRVASVNMEVNAISQKEMADLQIQQEEKQRVLGVFPNFFVAFDPHTVPLTAGQKFKLTGRTVVDPVLFGTAAVNAAVDHWTEGVNGFGPGAQGYFKWYAVAYSNAFVGITLGGAVLPSLLHQDPRYFYKGTGSVKSRLWYVATRAVVQKGDNGKWQPAYSNLGGDLGAALIDNAYYPGASHNWGAVTGESFGFSIVGEFAGNLLEEFVFSRVTTHRKKPAAAASSTP